ncbi:hypothetical protein D3C85_1904550 [compost metagenome]
MKSSGKVKIFFNSSMVYLRRSPSTVSMKPPDEKPAVSLLVPSLATIVGLGIEAGTYLMSPRYFDLRYAM